MSSNTDTRCFDVQALKETLAAGKTSPQAQRPTFSSPRGSRSPGGFSVKDGLDVPGSPASVVSIGSIGSEARYKKHSMINTMRTATQCVHAFNGSWVGTCKAFGGSLSSSFSCFVGFATLQRCPQNVVVHSSHICLSSPQEGSTGYFE